MTRMKRINADFYHAFGAIGIRLATNYTNFHELNIHRSCQRAFAQTKFVPKFVKICAIRGQKNFAAGKAKSALIRLIRVIRAAIIVALVRIVSSRNGLIHTRKCNARIPMHVIIQGSQVIEIKLLNIVVSTSPGDHFDQVIRGL